MSWLGTKVRCWIVSLACCFIALHLALLTVAVVATRRAAEVWPSRMPPPVELISPVPRPGPEEEALYARAVEAARAADHAALGAALEADGMPPPEHLDAWRPGAEAQDDLDRLLAGPGLWIELREVSGDPPPSVVSSFALARQRLVRAAPQRRRARASRRGRALVVEPAVVAR